VAVLGGSYGLCLEVGVQGLDGGLKLLEEFGYGIAVLDVVSGEGATFGA